MTGIIKGVKIGPRWSFSYDVLLAPVFFVLTHYRVHHPADIRQTSPALGIFRGALAASEHFFGLDSFHDQRAAVFGVILPDIFSGIFKAVADQIIHRVCPFPALTRRLL